MKAGEECGECLQGLAGRIAQAAGRGDPEVSSASEAAARAAFGSNFTQGGCVPTRIATLMLRAAQKTSGRPDPFEEAKNFEYARGVEAARRLCPLFGDSLSELCALAAAGNRIDFFRDMEEVEREWKSDDHSLAIDDTQALEEALALGGPLLFLADNAGELPFDLPLLEAFRRRGVGATYAVKGMPSQNDLTASDLNRFGYPPGGTTDTGTDWVGCELSETGEAFNRHWEQARIIFSKGMANLETLTEYPERLRQKRVFFSLVAKCRPVAALLGVKTGQAVAYDARRLFAG